MILDAGICTVAHKVNRAPRGGKPFWAYEVFFHSWYGETAFSTTARASDSRENSRISARIRVRQNRAITNHDIVCLANVPSITDDLTLYEVVDVWHGYDDQNKEPISNISLEVIS